MGGFWWQSGLLSQWERTGWKLEDAPCRPLPTEGVMTKAPSLDIHQHLCGRYRTLLMGTFGGGVPGALWNLPSMARPPPDPPLFLLYLGLDLPGGLAGLPPFSPPPPGSLKCVSSDKSLHLYPVWAGAFHRAHQSVQQMLGEIVGYLLRKS